MCVGGGTISNVFRRLYIGLKGFSVVALLGALVANYAASRHLLERGAVPAAGAGGCSLGVRSDGKGLLGPRPCELVRVNGVAVRASAAALCTLLLLHECETKAVTVPN